MDLPQMARVKAQFESLGKEEQDRVSAAAVQVSEFLEQQLPTLEPIDLSQVGWLVAALLAHLQAQPVGELSDTIYSSLIAYSLASLDFIDIIHLPRQ